MSEFRPFFRRWPWLAPIALVVCLPLYLAGGLLEGLSWWLDEARDMFKLLRGIR